MDLQSRLRCNFPIHFALPDQRVSQPPDGRNSSLPSRGLKWAALSFGTFPDETVAIFECTVVKKIGATGGGRGVVGGEGKNAPTGGKRRDVARDGANVCVF